MKISQRSLLSVYYLGRCMSFVGRVWRTDDKASLNSLIKMLPHPSFVYTSKFHPIIDKLAVTGGYDRLLRVWNLKTDDQHAEVC